MMTPIEAMAPYWPGLVERDWEVTSTKEKLPNIDPCDQADREIKGKTDCLIRPGLATIANGDI